MRRLSKSTSSFAAMEPGIVRQACTTPRRAMPSGMRTYRPRRRHRRPTRPSLSGSFTGSMAPTSLARRLRPCSASNTLVRWFTTKSTTTPGPMCRRRTRGKRLLLRRIPRFRPPFRLPELRLECLLSAVPRRYGPDH